ncbi:MAG TPA: ester cyclase [Nocardioides sp.]|uniref:ester cyclase n=1 Tax=Nocardioides sp. TaxID=35761 RepID=UPI002EDA9312
MPDESEVTTVGGARRERIERAWAAAWDRGDVAALDELMAESYQRHGSAGPAQDLAGLKASVTATRSAFPDLVTTIDEIVLAGDSAAIRWHSAGTHEGTLLGVPATRRRVEVSGATFAHFEDDRIVEEHVTWDPRALLTALGVISVGQD